MPVDVSCRLPVVAGKGRAWILLTLEGNAVDRRARVVGPVNGAIEGNESQKFRGRSEADVFAVGAIESHFAD